MIEYPVGDRVGWNSGAGRASGRIIDHKGPPRGFRLQGPLAEGLKGIPSTKSNATRPIIPCPQGRRVDKG